MGLLLCTIKVESEGIIFEQVLVRLKKAYYEIHLSWGEKLKQNQVFRHKIKICKITANFLAKNWKEKWRNYFYK